MYDDVGRVSADLVINGKELAPAQITELVGLEPDYSHGMGTPIFDVHGTQAGTKKSNYWRYGSTDRLTSKDLDEHVQMILAVFEPRAAVLRTIAERSDVFVWTLWESFGLILGAGPIISPASCRGIATIGAELHFDIVCLREHDLSGPPQGADGKAWDVRKVPGSSVAARKERSPRSPE